MTKTPQIAALPGMTPLGLDMPAPSTKPADVDGKTVVATESIGTVVVLNEPAAKPKAPAKQTKSSAKGKPEPVKKAPAKAKASTTKSPAKAPTKAKVKPATKAAPKAKKDPKRFTKSVTLSLPKGTKFDGSRWLVTPIIKDTGKQCWFDTLKPSVTYAETDGKFTVTLTLNEVRQNPVRKLLPVVEDKAA